MSARFNLKRCARFSLGTLMLAVLGTCGYLGGYRSGYDSGVRQQFRDTISVVSYDIEEFYGDDPSAEGMKRTTDELVALIKTTLHPNDWGQPYVPLAVDSQNGIEVSRDYSKLRITNYGRVHEDIENLFGQLRQLRR